MRAATRPSANTSVDMIDANACGNAVHSTTRAKISQTLFASHTGAIAWSMSARGRAPRRAPPAAGSQKPAPRAPAPRGRTPEAGPVVGPAQDHVTREGEPQDQRDEGAHDGLCSVVAW